MRGALQILRARTQPGGDAIVPEPPAGAPDEMPDAALETLGRLFELSSFERKILVMCAGVEWDARFAGLCAQAQDDPRRAYPTFSLALAPFEDAHWSALSPDRPLRYWRLLRMSSGDPLTIAPLRIDERILHYLTGIGCIDEELLSLLHPLKPPPWLAPSQAAVAAEIASVWSNRNGPSALPVVQMSGDEAMGKRAVAAAAFAQLGLSVYCLSARHLPHAAADLDVLRRLWEREALLSASALLLECNELEEPDEAHLEEAAQWMMEHVASPLAVAARNPLRCPARRQVLVEVRKPTSAEQGEIWRSALEPRLPGLNGKVAALVSQFSLGEAAISSVAGEARLEDAGSEPGPGLGTRLWDACRVHSRPRLQGLAQRIEAGADWDDLVLPEKQRHILRQIVIHVRRRARVYEEWGFAARNTRGLGISALFAGPSGTGRTMAAEVLANQLRPIYTAWTSARSSTNTSARRRRTCAACSTPPTKAPLSSSSTRRMRSSANAARSGTAMIATPTSK